MKKVRKVLIGVAVAAAAMGSIEWSDAPYGGISLGVDKAHAVRGRPLTPLSYAGTARRTSRRVARRTSVRIATLPRGCVYGPYYGASYWNCGGVYYVQSGNVYVQVVFD